MSKSAAKPNPFHNLSTEDLADQFGDVKAQIAALEDREDALKKELAARIDDVPAVGPRWTVTKSESVSRRLDTKALRELLGDGLAPYEKESVSVRMLVKPTMIFGQTAAE